ncbi:MAG: Gfo/Idh/MocA family oxidoreductase, partial [Phycisphaerales bacterium]
MAGETDRRTFMTATAAAAVAALEPSVVFGTRSNSKIDLGLIGCGGRGNWIANLFNETGKYRFVACADYFEDRVRASGGKLQIEPGRCYSGLSGYRRLLDDKLDAVVIESPPYFHPEQAAAAVDAGKHVFLAKPIAIDVPGCKSIGASGRKATSRKLVFLVDFQTRANEFYGEAVRRVRAGDLGRLVMGEAHYPWAGGPRTAPASSGEQRLRNWYCALEISGDFIVEQSIHALDVATWIAGSDPVRAVGSGGRKLRPEQSIWDHFAVTYWFEDDLLLS